MYQNTEVFILIDKNDKKKHQGLERKKKKTFSIGKFFLEQYLYSDIVLEQRSFHRG